MGYLGRRIGLSQDQGDSNPGAAGGAVGGGLLDLFAHGYFERQGDIYNDPGIAPVSGLTATGGIISDYVSGPAIYRAHVFTSSGTFDVTALGSNSPTAEAVEYLVVGGGGGGGYDAGGGGGAGAFRTNLVGHPLAQSTFPVSTSPGEYTVTIGAGGAGSAPDTPNRGLSGGDSIFGSITSPGGGGGGGVSPPPARTGADGGSGGGGAMSFNGGKGAYPGSPNPSPFRMGYDGGNGTDNGSDNIASGGGGGAGGAGSNGTAPAGPGGAGGAGSPIAIESATAKLYAGGGGGGAKSGPGTGGPGGGGAGGHRPSTAGTAGTYATGGGGGGGAVSPPAGVGGSGGSGIIVVRYQIGTIQAAKASGGVISFYGGKTIHTFTDSGSFTTEPNWDAGTNEVEYVVVGGGGAGNGGPGPSSGAGGGAGGFITGTTTISHPSPTTVQVGGGAASAINTRNGGSNSFFGPPLAAYGGGGGGRHINSQPNPIEDGQPGGSGGGANDGGGTAGSGNRAGAGSGSSAPITPQGNPGGAGAGNGGSNSVSGGGGGGAGQAGQNSVDQGRGGYGGYGKQVPATFQDPISGVGVSPNPTIYNGPNSGNYWVAGGGGGSGSAPPSHGATGLAGLGGGGVGYGNPSSSIPGPRVIMDAVQNTGGGWWCFPRSCRRYYCW